MKDIGISFLLVIIVICTTFLTICFVYAGIEYIASGLTILCNRYLNISGILLASICACWFIIAMIKEC